jgi:hypothetical protein
MTKKMWQKGVCNLATAAKLFLKRLKNTALLNFVIDFRLRTLAFPHRRQAAGGSGDSSAHCAYGVSPESAFPQDLNKLLGKSFARRKYGCISEESRTFRYNHPFKKQISL